MEKMKQKIQRIRAYVAELKKEGMPHTAEEWDRTIASLNESTEAISYLLDGYEEHVEKLTDIEIHMDEIMEHSDSQEIRLQQFEDRGQRAIDFINEQGLHEQFRRYYEKKKQSNLVVFPRNDE